uniref:CBS domain-containing protein n=1 Tax=Gongylonema pulchrum TaxID=637853 RepID=A0A183EQM2_9BILA
LQVGIKTNVCITCNRPISVLCIVPGCPCRKKVVKNCVMCCIMNPAMSSPTALDKETGLDWGEYYIDTDEYVVFEDLVRRISGEVINHNIVMVDFDIAKLALERGVRPVVAIDNAIRRMISHASLNSLIVVIFSSPENSIGYAKIKNANRRNPLF